MHCIIMVWLFFLVFPSRLFFAPVFVERCAGACEDGAVLSGAAAASHSGQRPRVVQHPLQDHITVPSPEYQASIVAVLQLRLLLCYSS
jgi:hypothetical protein